METRKLLLLSTSALALMGVGFVIAIFLLSLGPSEAVISDVTRPIRVSVADLKIGEVTKVRWSGSSIYILRRDLSDVEKLPELNGQLSDPRSEMDPDPNYIKQGYRSINPEYFVAYGYSTHCGCTLVYSGEVDGYSTEIPGGVFYDLCHIATYDIAGRVIAASAEPGPSKLLPPRVANLFIPPHRFSSDGAIVIGEEP